MSEEALVTSYECEAVCTMIMLVIGPGTLSALIRNWCEVRLMVHWRLIIATSIMSVIYILQIIWLAHLGYDKGDWSDDLIFCLFLDLWPLSMIPTLLYAWQYYDMVETAANP
jgi:hypothetical protein